MKTLLIAEYRQGQVLESYTELMAFAETLGAESAMFIVGKNDSLPRFQGTLYHADATKFGELQPGRA